MFVKIIITLIIFIAITALGANYAGEGFFGFNATAKAGKVIEYTRDLSNIMQTYRAADDSNQSAPVRIDTGLSVTVDAGTANDGQVLYNDVITELKSQQLLKGTGLLNHGGFAVGVDTAGQNVYLVDVSLEISNDICRAMNKQLSVGTQAANYQLTGDLSTLVNVNTELSQVMTGADVDLLAALHGIAGGTVEGACVEDSTGTNPNAMVYYVQRF